MIAEQNGALVWFHPLPAGETATNFEVQQYEGQPGAHLVAGPHPAVGFGQGEDVIYNSSYQQIARSAPATATAPTCTRSSSPRRAPPGSTPSTRST